MTSKNYLLSLKNGQLKPVYNVQIGVESEYIIQAQLFSQANDLHTLKPFLTPLEASFDRKYQAIVADSGYESEENDQFLKEKEYTSWIKPANHEQLKSRAFKKQIGRRENMACVAETMRIFASKEDVSFRLGLNPNKRKPGIKDK